MAEKILQKEDFKIRLKGGIEFKKTANFENEIVIKALNILSPTINKDVYLLNTQSFVDEEKRKKLIKQGVQNPTLISHNVAKNILLKSDIRRLEEIAKLTPNQELRRLNLENLKKLTKYLLEKEKKLSKAQEDTLSKLKDVKIERETEIELFSNVENNLIEFIKRDTKTTIDNLLEAIKLNNIIKFTTSDNLTSVGHAYLLYHNIKDDRYYIISSTGDDNTFKDLKEQYWFRCLSERINVDILCKNRQNFNQGCIFCASYTEHLLRTGKSIKDLADQMPKDIEKNIMEVSYFSIKPFYKDNDLTECNEEELANIFFINEKRILENISQDSDNSEAIIRNFRNNFPERIYSVAEERVLDEKFNLKDIKLYEINNDKRSSIRIRDQKNYKNKEIINKMSEILKQAILNTQKSMLKKKECELVPTSIFKNNHFVKSIIHFAQTYQGIGNTTKDKFVKYFQNKYTSEYYTKASLENVFYIAQNLSYQYQTLAKENNFFTGRTENLGKIVGQRLCRIPIEFTDNIVDDALKMLEPQGQIN